MCRSMQNSKEELVKKLKDKMTKEELLILLLG